MWLGRSGRFWISRKPYWHLCSSTKHVAYLTQRDRVSDHTLRHIYWAAIPPWFAPVLFVFSSQYPASSVQLRFFARTVDQSCGRLSWLLVLVVVACFPGLRFQVFFAGSELPSPRGFCAELVSLPSLSSRKLQSIGVRFVCPMNQSLQWQKKNINVLFPQMSLRNWYYCLWCCFRREIPIATSLNFVVMQLML